MNKKFRGILIGMILGDATLRVRKDTQYPNTWHNVLSIKHGEKQKEYIEYKANLIHSMFGGKPITVRPINNSGYPGYLIYKSHKYFRILYKRMYKNGKKTFTSQVLNWLTPEGIAIWYMDDGSLCAKKRNGKIHAYDLYLNTYSTKEENEVIIQYFQDAYDIHFTLSKNKGLYRIRCGTKEARKFIELVKPYIIPSMQYKIDMQ